MRFEAKGGAIGWSDKLFLNVGCGFWVEIFPAEGNFTKKMDLFVNDIEVYEIAKFQTDTPHCPVEDFMITANIPANTIKYPSRTCEAGKTCYLADIDTFAAG